MPGTPSFSKLTLAPGCGAALQCGLHPGLALFRQGLGSLSSDPPLPPTSPVRQSFLLPQEALVHRAPSSFTRELADATPLHPAPILEGFPPPQSRASSQPREPPPLGTPVMVILGPRCSLLSPWPSFTQAPSRRRLSAGSGLQRDPGAPGHLPFPGVCRTLPAPPSLTLPGC